MIRLLLALALFLFIYFAFMDEPPVSQVENNNITYSRPSTPYLTLSQQEKQFIENSLSDGLIKFEYGLRSIFVSQKYWDSLDNNQKERLARLCAIYLGNYHDDTNYTVTVLGQYRFRLAEWSYNKEFIVNSY